MALEYAYRYHGDYDLVWWIPAHQEVLARSAVVELASSLSLPLAATIGTHEAAQAVVQALSEGSPYRKWLLIFDTADWPEEILPFIPHGPGHVLITTRDRRWSERVSAVFADVFTREESVEFLVRRVPGGVGPAEVLRYWAFFGAEPFPRDVFSTWSAGLEGRISQVIGDPVRL